MFLKVLSLEKVKAELCKLQNTLVGNHFALLRFTLQTSSCLAVPSFCSTVDHPRASLLICELVLSRPRAQASRFQSGKGSLNTVEYAGLHLNLANPKAQSTLYECLIGFSKASCVMHLSEH